MAGVPAPLGASEAVEFEELAGQTVLAAVADARAGRLAARTAAVAVLIVARRDRPTTTLQQVLDHCGWYVTLLDSGTSALDALTADPPAARADQEADDGGA